MTIRKRVLKKTGKGKMTPSGRCLPPSARGPKFEPQKPLKKRKKKQKLVQWPECVIPVLGRQTGLLASQTSQLANSKFSEPTERLYLRKQGGATCLNASFGRQHGLSRAL